MYYFYPIKDRLLMELKQCFSTGTNDELSGVSALSLKHMSSLNRQLILPMAQHFGVSREHLIAELYQVCHLLQRKEQGHTTHSTQEFLSFIRP